MAGPPRSRLAGLVLRAKAQPAAVLLWAFAAAVTAYVVVLPFSAVRYPPLIDLPFHAAQTSIFRHYLDPVFHFHEQFSLHPIAVPYLSMYGFGALAALVVPIETAVKLEAIGMLLLLPAGLAVLFHGMRKSPLLGLLGLSLCWGTLANWGFLNFLGALGLYAAAVGFALLAVDRASRGARVALALCLVAIFFTHIYRLPFALLSVVAAGAAVYPATRRFRPLLLPMVPACALFALWLVVRDEHLVDEPLTLSFDLARLEEIPKHLFGAYLPPEPAPMTALGAAEQRLSAFMLAGFAVLAAASVVLSFRARRADPPSPAERAWKTGVTVLPLVLAGGFLLTYLVLPMQLGLWWYVYPREITSAVFIAAAALPDLPRGRVSRPALVFVMALTVCPMAAFATRQFERFDTLTADFDAIVDQIPPAPRLLYLVYDRTGTDRRTSPILHLPAWVQAKRGGALAFHLVAFNHSPIRYRSGSDAVPPALPAHFEWEPQHFRIREHGRWFDTFLVRHQVDPSVLFRPDPGIRLTGRVGTWWLYRRNPPEVAGD